MIYLDTSVVLAHVLAEDRHPPENLWEESLVSSRLLEYELWTRLHARELSVSHGDMAEEILARIAVLELTRDVLARALEPFPLPVRTLDALHLASLEFLRGLNQDVELASYDDRQIAVARRLGIPICSL